LIAFVIFRDRVSYARRCIDALYDARLDVVIVDHDSAWPSALDLLDRARRLPALHDGTPRLVRDTNRHPRDLWRLGGPIGAAVGPGERFIVTDCDVVPDEGCPGDWPALLGELLDRFPNVAKAGLGLRIDDLPDHFAHKARVIEWETGVLDGVYAEGRARRGDIDTTLAMYRRYEPFALGPALRTVAPYMARHLPWYEDTANPTPEQAFYRKYAEYGHWRDPDGYADTHNLEA